MTTTAAKFDDRSYLDFAEEVIVGPVR